MVNDMEKDPDFLKYMAQLGLRDLYLNQSDELRQGLLKQQGATQDAWLQAGRAITKFALPPVFSLGVVGNLLSILVLARYGVRRSSTAFYLFVLSCLDLVSLLAGVPVLYVADVFDEVVRNKSNLMCKLQPFATYILTQYAAWVIVAVTVDRLVWIALPFRAKQLCTLRVSCCVLVALFVVLCALNAYLPLTHELQPEYRDDPRSNLVCVPIERFVHLSRTLMPWLDVVLLAGVPFFLITLANAIIIYYLRRYGRVHRRLKKNALAPKRSNAAAAGIVENKAQNAMLGGRSSRSSTPQRDSARDRSLTLMLLTISILFIVSNLPITILNYVSLLLHVNTKESTTSTRLMEELNDNPKDTKLDETFTFLRSLFSLFVYVNISCHFGMFIFSGKLFRREFMLLLESWPCVRNCCRLPLSWMSRHSSFSRKTSCESLAVIANGGGDRAIPLMEGVTCSTSVATSQSNGLHRSCNSPSIARHNSHNNNNNNNIDNRSHTPSPCRSRNGSANAQMRPSVLIYVPASGSRAARSVSAVIAPNNLNCSECAAAIVTSANGSIAGSASRTTTPSLLVPKMSPKISATSTSPEMDPTSSGLLETDL